MRNYLKFVFGCNMLIADQQTQDKLEVTAGVAEIPAFPENGCCQYVDKVLVMKIIEPRGVYLCSNLSGT